jgi:hypothetical protein
MVPYECYIRVHTARTETYVSYIYVQHQTTAAAKFATTTIVICFHNQQSFKYIPRRHARLNRL